VPSGPVPLKILALFCILSMITGKTLRRLFSWT
jgi:hypothetical protein